jgi:hypothetical protein
VRVSWTKSILAPGDLEFEADAKISGYVCATGRCEARPEQRSKKMSVVCKGDNPTNKVQNEIQWPHCRNDIPSRGKRHKFGRKVKLFGKRRRS